MNAKKLKSIAFDLDTKALQEHYTKGDWHNAYNDINSFLYKQNFIHTQGSVYDSTTKFSDEELGILVKKMSNEFQWLSECVKSIRGYDQPVMIDYTEQIRDKSLSINKDLEVKSPTKEHSQKEQAKKQLMEQVKQSLHKDRDSKSLSQDKDRER